MTHPAYFDVNLFLEGVFSHRCPGTHLELEEFQSASPYANTSAGQYFKLGVLSMEKCIYSCCEMLECNIVFIHNNICYLIKCESDKSCEPLPRDGVKFQNTYIVKVRPVQGKQDIDVITTHGIRSM